MNLTKTDSHFFIYFTNCYEIQKIRIGFQNSRWAVFKNNRNYNEISNIEKLRSKYSWKELLNMLDIKDQETMNTYLKKYKLI